MIPIDVDDRTTWPRQINELVTKWAMRCKDTTEYTNDLALPLEDEGSFRALFAGHLLRAYHCTRLLPHEVSMVRTIGLRPLSADLLRDRINAAQAAGSISPAIAANLHTNHVYASGEQRHREGQVCLILSKRLFKNDPQACEPLLMAWGGEGIYSFCQSMPRYDQFRDMGSPTVVIALLDISNKAHHIFSALHKVFVGAALGLQDAYADVFYKSPVPPEHIEQILQPGNPHYHRLGLN